MEVPAAVTIAGSKRPPPSPSVISESQSTTSTQSQSQSRQPPPAKRQRLASPTPTSTPAPAPSIVQTPTDPIASTSTLPAQPAPTKRPRHEGTLRRLEHAVPRAAGVQPKATLSGSKIGGKSKDLNVTGAIVEEMWITRQGLSFGGYLKKGVAAFLERG
ncbi:hypothetical protein P7C70_g2337, partial [Phenoliferia sp. Uapishka_3]